MSLADRRSLPAGHVSPSTDTLASAQDASAERPSLLDRLLGRGASRGAVAAAEPRRGTGSGAASAAADDDARCDDVVCASATAPTVCDLRFGGVPMRIVSRSRTELRRALAGKERWTEEWVRALPSDAVLWDVGANTGLFSLLACLAPEGGRRRVVAVEPAYLNVPSLVDNVRVNGLADRIVVLPVAVGDATAAGTLQHENLVPGGAMHSISEIAYLKPTRSTVSRFSQAVLVYRLDDLVGIPGLPFPTHLKIDVDGAEALLLSGAEATLADTRIRGVQVESIDHEDERRNSATIEAAMTRAGLRLDRVIDHNEVYPRVSDLQFSR